MSFFDLFKKADTRKLAKSMYDYKKDDSAKEALNSIFPENAIKESLDSIQSSMIKGEEFFVNGMKSAEKGNLNESIDNFNKSIEYYDSASGPYVNRGAVYHKLRKYEKAVQDYKKAISLELEDDTGAGILNVAKYNLEILNEMGYY